MWPRVFGRPYRSFGNPGGGGISVYLLQDTFTTARAAGSVNGTPAEPTGQTRTVTDGNSKLSITGGLADLATGGVGIGNPGLWYPSMTLRVGQMLLMTISNTGVGPSEGYFGWFTAASNSPTNSLFFISSQIRWNANLIIDAYVSATVYKIAIIQRSTGAWLFIKNGTFTNWTLVWISTTGAGLLPGLQAGGTGTVATADDIRVPIALYIPSPLAYDTFTRSDGALGSTETTGPDSQVISAIAWVFTTGIWTIATNKAVGTPATLGADVIVNGAFAADTNWSKGTGWTIAAGVATVLNAAAASITESVLTTYTWYQAQFDLSNWTKGDCRLRFGALQGPKHQANGTYIDTGRSDGTATAGISANGTDASYSIDNISYKPLTLAELIASVVVSTADVWAEIAVTLSAALGGLQAGLCVNLDSTSNPQNFILCYLDGRGNCVLEECVAGVYTTKFTTAITYAAGAVLRVVRDGTSCRVFYNNAAVSSLQTMTANTNARHGLFSTSALNSLDGFAVWARGKANEHSILDTY